MKRWCLLLGLEGVGEGREEKRKEEVRGRREGRRNAVERGRSIVKLRVGRQLRRGRE